MQSIRSRIVVKALEKRRYFMPRKLRIDYVDYDTPVELLRQQVEKGTETFGKLPANYTLENININGLNAEKIIPPGAPDNRIILYFHGGGLICGSALSHRAVVSKFVRKTGISAIVFDYALAPENPYPAALNDSLKIYDYLIQQGYDSENIILIGDSGGGNLALSLPLALKMKGQAMPAGIVALSPWLDLTNSGESRKFNSELDTLCWKNSEIVFSSYYCGKENPTNPLVSPLFGDLHGLPPIRLFAGGHETMLSDSVSFVEKALSVGVDAKLTVGEGLFHCYPACAPLFPEAVQAMDEIEEFVKERLGITSLKG